MQENTCKQRACAYARVSTSSKAQLHSFATQVEYWDDYMKSQQNYEYVGLYADEGISAKTNKTRKQFMQMIQDACAGKIDKIFTKSFTRFGRNDVESLEAIRTLREHNVSVYFDSEKLDSSDPNADFVIGILASVAREELIQVSENQKWAIDKRYAKGAAYINNQTLGLKMQNKQIVVDETQRWIVEKIFKLYLEGNGVTMIARMLTEEGVPQAKGGTEWRAQEIAKILKNEKYCGDSLQHKVYKTRDMRTVKNKGEVKQYYIQNNHEAIIDRETFERVQAILQERTPKNLKGQQKKLYPFSGKVVCGHDGKCFRRKFEGYKTKRGIYKCIEYLTWGKSKCNNSAILESELERNFVDAYNEYLGSITQDESIEELKAQVKEKIGKERELKALMINKYISREQYDSLNNDLVKQAQELEQKLRRRQREFNNNYKDNPITQFDPEKVEKHLDKAIVHDYEVTYRFKNGYETTRRYDNGKSGNRRKSNN